MKDPSLKAEALHPFSALQCQVPEQPSVQCRWQEATLQGLLRDTWTLPADIPLGANSCEGTFQEGGNNWAHKIETDKGLSMAFLASPSFLPHLSLLRQSQFSP